MSTWQEAVEYMAKKITNCANCDAMYLYRIHNGQIERTTWKGGNPWVPHIPDNAAITDWNLTEPF